METTYKNKDMVKNSMLMKTLPLLLIFGGFLSLSMFPPALSFCCMGMGIFLLLERKCPEKWEAEKRKHEYDNELNVLNND